MDKQADKWECASPNSVFQNLLTLDEQYRWWISGAQQPLIGQVAVQAAFHTRQ